MVGLGSLSLVELSSVNTGAVNLGETVVPLSRA
jgi:hypothetical protein